METKPALFLDFDGTIRHSKSGKFIGGPDDVALFPGVEKELLKWKEKGFVILGVTNQGGVAFGIRTIESVRDDLVATLALFEQNPIHRVECCFCHPKGKVAEWTRESMFRKPNPGMLAKLEEKVYADGIIIDWANSLMVGDRPEDEECAHRAGILFQWAWEFFGRPVPEDAPLKLDKQA